MAIIITTVLAVALVALGDLETLADTTVLLLLWAINRAIAGPAPPLDATQLGEQD